MEKIETVSCEFPDELKFVDDDIRKEFEGKNYIIGTPTQVQLNRSIKLLTEKIDKLLDKC